ncbi:recombinase family protein [Garciella nitratireducens]|uniref:Site-specific DNA recombinase n=1 Tax=Garciella nitratireducens DSM 15102 TaxID=1121911 RepID=A0A1T4K7P3_9FIRM|nr:recombinase family protein [Garciella nitratireducens]SJZ38454.1 site-specific DNA recombinase [Garciella nitratireducens DSM 15102]
MKVAIYSRKSKFTGKGDSIENQIQLCKNYAFTHYDLKDEDILVYEDEGFSGGNTDRPQFQLMMKDAKKKKFDLLICYRLDRISRSVMDFSNTFESLEDNDIGFVSIKEQFDTSTPMGKAMLYISSVFAQLERETTAERIRDNMMQLARTGRWLGGQTPTGYESQQVTHLDHNGKERKMFKLSPIPKELETVKIIYDKYMELKSLTQVEQYLIVNNIKTKNNLDFRRYSIRFILSNPVYAIADEKLYEFMMSNDYEVCAPKSDFTGNFGVMAYNKTKQNKKSSVEARDVSEWIVAVGQHEGIIDSDTWIKVQKMLNRNKSKSFRKVKSTTSLLSGLLYCADCGSYMRPKMGRIDKNGQQIFYYMCEMKEKSKRTRCSMKNVKGNDLDKLVIEEIKRMAHDNSELKGNLQSDKLQIETKQNTIHNEIINLETNIKNNEQSINNLVSSLSKSQESAASKYIIQQINQLDKETAEMKERLLKLKENEENNNMKDNSLNVMGDMLAAFNDNIDEVDIEAKRMFLKSIIDKITWDGEIIKIYMFGMNTEKKL